MINIGVIGPNDSVKKIKTVAKRFKDIEIVPFIYRQIEETEQILKQKKYKIDFWLFSGPVPYEYAVKKKLISPHKGFYVCLHGSSFFGTLLEANLKLGKVIKTISLDTIGEKELDEIKDSYAIRTIKIYRMPSKRYLSVPDIVQFHETLFKEKKIEVALTCISSVYEALKKRNVPVFRVNQSEYSISSALKYLRERAYAKYYERKQFAIFGIKVNDDDQLKRPINSFHYMRKEVELYRFLIDFVEKINGTLLSAGKGLFYIYTTKGDLELFQVNHSFAQFITDMENVSDLSVKIGIGYGNTVLEAKDHLLLALNIADEDKQAAVVVIDEMKNLTKYRSNDEHLQYQLRNPFDKWGDKLERVSFSRNILAKIESLTHYYQITEVTSKVLSNWLNITERYARRILKELEEIGLAEKIGEESSGRGRPKIIYKLHLQ